jgi:hypothetical protein
MRRFSPLLLTALLVAAIAAPASAQTADQVADRVGESGTYVDPGLDVDQGALADAVRRASNAGFRLLVVLLDDDPAAGAATFADAVLDRVGDGTVLVLSATGEGAASSSFDQAALERALDAGFSAGGGDLGYVEGFLGSLAPDAAEAGDGGSGGGGSGGLIILLVIVGLLVLVVWWVIRRQRKAGEDRREQAIAEARGEIRGQLDAMANTILEITDRVSASASREDNAHLEAASATFTEASEAFETATDLRSLEGLSDRLDEARWQLDAAEAISHGREVPDKPKPTERHACFFDPTHPGPFEDAEIRTAAGERVVKVCAEDAERLRKGRDPEPRMIEVEGRRVPAPAAPRSHGGGGMDLGSIFSVLVGGAAGRSFDWGSPPRRRGGGLFGPTPRRASGSSSAGASRSRSRAGRTRRRRR